MMFWRRRKTVTAEPKQAGVSFAEAKEATRRAAFLNVAQGMTTDENYKQGLAELFRVCRSQAITAGTAEGKTEAEVDAAISALCDADTARLKNASDEDFRQFTEESGKIIKSFLARI